MTLETNIGNEVQVPGLTVTSNSVIRCARRSAAVSPTTIRIRAWAMPRSEPSTWNYTATNSVAALQAPGGVGLMAYLGSGSRTRPVTISFDDLAVTGLEGVTNTPRRSSAA